MKLRKLAMSEFEKNFGNLVILLRNRRMPLCSLKLSVSSHKELEIAKVHYELTMQNKAIDEHLFTPSGFFIFREALLLTIFVSRCSFAFSCLCRTSSHSELKSIQVIYVVFNT